MTSTDELFNLARAVLRSKRYPDQHKKTQRLYDQFQPRQFIEILDEEATLTSVYITLVRGVEAGLSPLTALYNIVWYNDRPCIYGDVALAMVESSPNFAGIEEGFTGEQMEDDWTAYCDLSKTVNGTQIGIERSFSWADAKRAGLDKLEHYQKYPQRMLAIRARTWAMRDLFADVLHGLSIAEEQRDVELSKALPEDPIQKAQTNAATNMDPFTKAALEKRGAVDMPSADSLKPGTELPLPASNSDSEKSLEHEISDVDVASTLNDAEERHKKRRKSAREGLDIAPQKF